MRENVYRRSHEICVGGTTILTDYPVRDAFVTDGGVSSCATLTVTSKIDYPNETPRVDNALATCGPT